MEIQFIQEQGVPKRTKILVDGEVKKRVSHSIISLKDLESIARDENFFTQIREREAQGAVRYALFYLSRQALHSKKLEKKLQSHFLDAVAIAAAIDYCQKYGLLNDEEWTENAVKKWQAQGKSTMDVKARLRKQGVEIGHGVLDDRESLERLITRKYPQLLDAKTPYKERTRALQALQRRGFSFSSVQEFLQKKRITTMMGQESEEFYDI